MSDSPEQVPIAEQRISLKMARSHLRDLPHRPLPGGYFFRTFKAGDEQAWVSVQTAAGLFETEEKAREQFDKEFAQQPDEMASRCFFIVHAQTGEDVGAAVAWHNRDHDGDDAGRVHWVGVRPEHRGQGLGTPLVVRILERLAESHEFAVLGTNTTCKTAIRIYLEIGFEPVMSTERAAEAWAYLAKELKHAKLAQFA